MVPSDISKPRILEYSYTDNRVTLEELYLPTIIQLVATQNLISYTTGVANGRK